MKIQIRDNQFAHGTSIGYGDLQIHPEYFEWTRDRSVGSKYIFMTESAFLTESIPDNALAIIIEPRSISEKPYEFLKRNYTKFKFVLSHDLEWNKSIPNSMYYPFGGCWIKPEDRMVYQKTKLVSIIASDKTHTEGHRLRHEVISSFAKEYNIDVFGRGYNPIDYKLEALKDYKYSIVIENENSPGWFTEKLIDCLQTGTIPLYWGNCLDFIKYVDCLSFNTIDELEDDLKLINKQRFALSYFRHDHFRASKEFICPEDWMFKNYQFLFI